MVVIRNHSVWTKYIYEIYFYHKHIKKLTSWSGICAMFGLNAITCWLWLFSESNIFETDSNLFTDQDSQSLIMLAFVAEIKACFQCYFTWCQIQILPFTTINIHIITFILWQVSKVQSFDVINSIKVFIRKFSILFWLSKPPGYETSMVKRLKIAAPSL